jgi:hypothetical protein
MELGALDRCGLLPRILVVNRSRRRRPHLDALTQLIRAAHRTPKALALPLLLRDVLTLPGAPQAAVYPGCGTSTSLQVTTGLSVGWGDIYRSTLPDQYIDITNLSAGRYQLLVTADKLGWFTESNESNNSTWVDLQFKGQGQPKIVGYGPAA